MVTKWSQWGPCARTTTTTRAVKTSVKKMNLRSFNFNRVYLVPLNKSNAVTFLKLPNKLFVSGLSVGQINNRSMPKIKIK